MVEVREVNDAKELRAFIRLPWKIYKNDPNWVPPLISDVKRTLDRKKSPFFEFGEAIYYIAYKEGAPAGRISAHINNRHNTYQKATDGFFGFYECIDDPEVSDSLLKAACDWVKSKGMTRILGPASFTIYDEPCFMIDGWDADPPTPIIMQNYNPRYYLDQMAKSGFGKEIDWYAYRVDEGRSLSKAMLGAKERLIKSKGFVFRNVDLKHIDDEVVKIKEIFNDAWSENWGHHPYTERQVDRIKEALVAIVDPRLCYMVETSDGQPVACAVILPDINPAVRKMNGRILPIGWIYLLRARRRTPGTRAFMMGVLKPYRHTGVDVAMVVEAMVVGPPLGYKWADCSLIVETNEPMIRLVEKWGGARYKSYRIFSRRLS
ncbi:MAG TPA: hypothetical protein VMV68_09690 [Spirochaetia bacterium]|nr:hypothetical protein [Spirochaetia bacterium]